MKIYSNFSRVFHELKTRSFSAKPFSFALAAISGVGTTYHMHSNKSSRPDSFGPLRTHSFSSRIFNPDSICQTSSTTEDAIAEALQSELAITTAENAKPIVATYGCGPCVAIGGYDPTNKIAFIVHFSNAEEVRKSGGLILYHISKLVKNPISSPIQLHLRGGYADQSEPIIEAIKVWMKLRNDLPMEIASEDTLTEIGTEKSLLMDSRNGKVSEYNPLENPKRRDLSDHDIMKAMMSAFEPKITLAYAPK